MLLLNFSIKNVEKYIKRPQRYLHANPVISILLEVLKLAKNSALITTTLPRGNLMNFSLITHKVTITVNLMDSLFTNYHEDLVFIQEKNVFVTCVENIYVIWFKKKKFFVNDPILRFFTSFSIDFF